MIISDATITELVKKGELVIEPFDAESVQPASIDLRLGSSFATLKEHVQSTIELDQPLDYVSVEAEEIIINPQTFLLATTLEYIEIPAQMTAFVEGRSSIGRIGLFVQNAGWVDPGFKGHLTLELFNANRYPIRLTSGRRICQLVVSKLDRPAQRPYQGKYLGQSVATGSLVHKDHEVAQGHKNKSD